MESEAKEVTTHATLNCDHSGSTDNRSAGSGEQMESRPVVLTASATVAVDPEIIEAQEKAQDARFAARASVVLSCILTPMAYGAYVYGKLHGIDLEPPDWVLGLILAPFGGGAWIWLQQKQAEIKRPR